MFFNFPPALLIPLLALLIPIVAIVAHYVGMVNRERERHLTIRELARAGQPIPPELLADLKENDWSHSGRDESKRAESKPNRFLIAAIINIAVGIGLMGMFATMMPGAWLWSIGLIPACLGLGLVVIWHIERKDLAAAAQRL